MEIWKDIPNYEGYQVSNLGRIRTHNKTTYTQRHGERHWKDRILKQKYCKKDKCHRIELWKDGKHQTFLVHRLIACAFLNETLDTKLTVNHKDGNRNNNNIDNLEFLSMVDNIRHAFDNNLCNQYNCKLINVNNEVKEYNSLAKASCDIGRAKAYISNCLKKNRKIYDIYGNEYTVEIKNTSKRLIR